MCGCRCARLRFFSLFFSLPVGVSRFWAGMAHASCVLAPVVVVICKHMYLSTVSCRYSVFGRDHDSSPRFLLYPFLSLFAKSFLLAITTIFFSFFFFFFFSFMSFFLSFFSLLPLRRAFCSNIFFSSVSAAEFPIPGLLGLHLLPCHWTCSVRPACEFK